MKSLKPLLLLLLFILPKAASACLWDTDTLSQEAKAKLDATKTMLGILDRNPPLYYEMRLERVGKAIEGDPMQLALYDDAGVACDRLGRDGEAIEWMRRKKEMRDQAPEDQRTTDTLYKYNANLGTFYAHEWIRSGGDRNNMTMLRQGRDCIREAIAINPGAHFGREKYQLMAMEWLLEPPRLATHQVLSKDDKTTEGWKCISTYVDPVLNDRKVSTPDLEAAIEGLTGLVALGNAWKSVDTFLALECCLHMNNDSSLEWFAHERVLELLKQGKMSLHPEMKAGMAFLRTPGFNVDWYARPVLPDDPHAATPMRQSIFREQAGFDDSRTFKLLSKKYKELRNKAEARNDARTKYMLKRLQTGRHPDTDPDFWKEYKEPEIDWKIKYPKFWGNGAANQNQ